MMIINFDLSTGLAKLAQTTTIVLGAIVPVQVVFSAAPGTVNGIELALGDDSSSPQNLASEESFTSDNDTTWSAVLDAGQSGLVTFMSGKNATNVNVELAVTIDGNRQVAPHFSIAIQPRIINGPPSGDPGITYYTAPQVDTKLASYALLTVAGKYRITGAGDFQLWNATQNKWHSITVTGAAGAEVLQIGAGQS